MKMYPRCMIMVIRWINALTTTLGYENDIQVNELVLGFLLIMTPISSNTFPIYEIYNILDWNIHENIDEFILISVLRYPSFLFSLFVYKNFEYFKSPNLKTIDEKDILIIVLK